MTVLWLAIAILSVAVELVATHFILFFVALAALLAAVCSALHLPLILQVVLFAVASVSLPLILRRRLLAKLAGPGLPSRVDDLIGKQCVVTEAIGGELHSGRVLAAGMDWKAASDSKIDVGRQCVVVGSRGIELIVEEIDNTDL